MVPAVHASEEEVFALGEVLREVGTGVIQCGGGRAAEMQNRLVSRLSQATGCQVVYNSMAQTVRDPNGWKEHMAIVDETFRAGIRAYPLCSPSSSNSRFTMRNCQVFMGIASWFPILRSSREQQIMSLEKAVRRLTFESASTFGIFDRGLLHPGMAADITIFDPETVKPTAEEVVHDFPEGGHGASGRWRRGGMAHRDGGGGDQMHHC